MYSLLFVTVVVVYAIHVNVTILDSQLQLGPNLQIKAVRSTNATLNIQGQGGADFLLTRHTKNEQKIETAKSFVNGLDTGLIGTAIGDQSIISTNAISLGYRATASDYGSIAIGTETLNKSTAGGFASRNIAIGYRAAANSWAHGFQCQAIGAYAQHNSAWSNNVAVGESALYLYPSSGNVAVGSHAMVNAQGNMNTAAGFSAGHDLVSVNSRENVHIGAFSGHGTPTTASRNSAVGYGTQAINVNECIVMGYQAQATGNNQFTLSGNINLTYTASPGPILLPTKIANYLSIKIGTQMFRMPLYLP